MQIRLPNTSVLFWTGGVLLFVFKSPTAMMPSFWQTCMWSVVACLMILLAFSRKESVKCNWPLLLFVIWIPVSLILSQPNGSFRSWERFAYFVLSMTLLSPLITNRSFEELRKRIYVCLTGGVFLLTGLSFAVLVKRLAIDHNYILFGFNGVLPDGLGLSHLCSIATFICVAAIVDVPMSNKPRSVALIAITLICLLMMVAGGSRMGVMSFISSVIYLSVLQPTRKMLAVGLTLLAVFCSMIFLPYMDNIVQTIAFKFDGGLEHGSLTYSRDTLWGARWKEFLESPVYGVGFSSIRHVAYPWDNYDKIIATGNIQPGSSWLGVMAQTGIVGMTLVATLLVQAIKAAFRSVKGCMIVSCARKKFPCDWLMSPKIVTGIFLILLIHSITEGYILAPGSLHFMMFWCVLSLVFAEKTQDSYNQRSVREYDGN